MSKVDRPACVKEKHLKYLDSLRESGSTNMFGARSWLMNAYGSLSADDARTILCYWLESFEERHPREEKS